MRWTMQKPEKPGWYWFRETALSENEIVYVYEGGTGLFVNRHGELYKLDNDSPRWNPINGEWSSTPIPEPEAL